MEGLQCLSDSYEVTRVLGKGSSGLVLLGVRREDQKEVAMKIISKHEAALSMRTALDAESEVLKRMDSDRIVRLIEYLEDEDYGCEVIEYIPGGDLFKQLTKRRQGFQETQALEIMEGVLEGLVHLHAQGVAHRDLKLDNIMMEGGDPRKVKLIDFGLSFSSKGRSSEFCGTLKFSAPEIVTRRPYVPEKVDMWSTGIVLYTLITRRLPFSGSNYSELTDAIVRSAVPLEGGAWARVSEPTKELLRALLCKNPRLRPSAEQCLTVVRNILYNKECDAAAVTRALSAQPEVELPKSRVLARAFKSARSGLKDRRPSVRAC